ncbi:hypothetical protein BH24CHL3_BH24CHL3_11600 [soil metagenome]
MHHRFTRRGALAVAFGAVLASRRNTISARTGMPDWTIPPIGWPDRLPGDGFKIGHGFACENTWFAAGWWHTGEDWYAAEGDSAGANVYAVAEGQVVYADFNYPGRVVIVKHEQDLFSMYGHIDPDTVIQAGLNVAAGDYLGAVLRQAPVRAPGQAPSHLHVEMRTFLTRDDVNGATPQHGVNCGFQCPPGPGYWPISASMHPVELGWRNPTHERLSQLKDKLPDDIGLLVNPAFVENTLPLYTRPDASSERCGALDLDDDRQVWLLDIRAGAPDPKKTSAEGYHAWFRVRVGQDRAGWVRSAVASDRETGSDGRPSAVDVPLLIGRKPTTS